MYVLHMYYAIHATINYYYLTEYLHKKEQLCVKKRTDVVSFRREKRTFAVSIQNKEL